MCSLGNRNVLINAGFASPSSNLSVYFCVFISRTTGKMFYCFHHIFWLVVDLQLWQVLFKKALRLHFLQSSVMFLFTFRQRRGETLVKRLPCHEEFSIFERMSISFNRKANVISALSEIFSQARYKLYRGIPPTDVLKKIP